jgi:hypothetical protein
MHEGKFIFAQLMDIIPWRRFQTCVDRYHGDRKITSLHCHKFFRIMTFAQITGRNHLSEIVFCLNAVNNHLYHIGIHRCVTKINLAHANNT